MSRLEHTSISMKIQQHVIDLRKCYFELVHHNNVTQKLKYITQFIKISHTLLARICPYRHRKTPESPLQVDLKLSMPSVQPTAQITIHSSLHWEKLAFPTHALCRRRMLHQHTRFLMQVLSLIHFYVGQKAHSNLTLEASPRSSLPSPTSSSTVSSIPTTQIGR